MNGSPRDYIQDEPMLYATERNSRTIKNYRREFQDTHCRVHFCHKGPYLCPICPAIDAGETLAGDLEWLLQKLKKKYKLEVYRRTKTNKTWTWNIRTINS